MNDTEFERRLEKLERDNRMLKYLGLAALVIVAVLGAIAATRPFPTVIKANAFEVTNSMGRVRVSLSPDALRFFDEKAVPRAAFGIHSGEPLLLLEGKAGTVGLDTFSRFGTPGIWLLDRNGKLRAAMQLVGKGAVISLHDVDGKGHVTLDEFPSGPLISLADAQGFGMDLGSTSIGTPATGASENTSAASIVMFGNDKKHHVIWRAP